MPKIKRLSHVVLYVHDLDKMTAFYRDVVGLVKYREYPGRMVFMTPDPKLDDHQLALCPGREGDAKIIAHMAWGGRVPSRRQSILRKPKGAGRDRPPHRKPRLPGDGKHRLVLFPRPRREPF